jgi:hypothetical protein
MRIFKFRTFYEGKMWDASVGDDGHVCIWRDDDDIEQWGSHCIGHCHERNNILKQADNLMQFTGSYDKNGKEIWEGDIVKVDTNWTRQLSHSFAEIFYSSTCSFQYKFYGSPNGKAGTAKPLSGKRLDHLEVVGNIHENKELLFSNGLSARQKKLFEEAANILDKNKLECDKFEGRDAI